MNRTAPVSTLLCNASKELIALQIRIKKIEAVVSDLIKESPTVVAARLAEFQELDQMEQSIANVARFLNNTANVLPDGFSIEIRDALDGIELQALAQRLRSESRDADPPDSTKTGECIWF